MDFGFTTSGTVADLVAALGRLDPAAKIFLTSHMPMPHILSSTSLTGSDEVNRYPRTLLFSLEIEQIAPWPKAE